MAIKLAYETIYSAVVYEIAIILSRKRARVTHSQSEIRAPHKLLLAAGNCTKLQCRISQKWADLSSDMLYHPTLL